jgi:hypothetical protein
MNNLPENDIALGNIDGFFPVDKAHKDILLRVEDLVNLAVENQDLTPIERAVVGLLSVSRISGIALAKILYLTKFQWDNFNRRGTWEDWAIDTFVIERITVKRYFLVWEMLVSGDIPREYCKKLEIMPIKSLIPISSMWKQKFEPTTQQWQRLANATNHSTVTKIIREIKKVEPKENSLQIEWDAEGKSVTGWKNGKPHVIRLMYDESDEVIIAMLSRLFADRVMEK